MSYALSPSIDITERDFLTPGRQTANRFAGTVGNFMWGPVGERVFITDEKELVTLFNPPDALNRADWFCAANYLAYNDKLYLVRVITESGSLNAGIKVTGSTGADAEFTVLRKNLSHEPTVTSEALLSMKIIAKYPGAYGNNISVAVANKIGFDAGTATIDGTIKFNEVFEFGPSATEYAVAVFLNDVLVEQFIVSTVQGTKNYKGEDMYANTYIAENSKYIYFYNNDSVALTTSFDAADLSGGAHVAPGLTEYEAGYDLFANKEELDIDVIFESGCVNLAGGEAVAEHIIENILEDRKDCRGVFGVPSSEVVSATATVAVGNMIDYVNDTLQQDSTYAALYGNYKYQRDKYNSVYAWVPITGDVAGIYSIGQAWDAPAGLNRGVIKNCIKLAVNPNEGHRDAMYPKGINPVYTLKGVGAVVMGQKTLKTTVPSLFSRVDVRGLFILLEKNAADVARYYQFQKNNATERRRFVSDVEPLFRQVQGLGGIDEYLIVCDETNNTADVINAQTLVVDFYIRPTQSAEWIRLNFNATQASVNFEELMASPV